MSPSSSATRRGFTLVELLVVIGIIAVLISVLLPALNKARAASRSTVCLSNLRQMGMAWTTYLHESKGRLPHSVWTAPTAIAGTPRGEEYVWRGFWFGLLGQFRINSSQLLCPEAQDPVVWDLAGAGGVRGAGTARNAWSGQWQNHSSAVGIRLDSTKVNNTLDITQRGYRVGSYGFNGNLFHDKRPAPPPPGPRSATGSSAARFGPTIGHVKQTSEVPTFYDCTWIDNINMPNGDVTSMPQAPPNLQGTTAPSGNTNQHWRILLDRHNRAINIAFADGHARKVLLEDTFQCRWTPYWVPYPLKNLPKRR